MNLIPTNFAEHFGIIASLISIVSALFSYHVWITERAKNKLLSNDLKKLENSFEAGLISLIGQMDKISHLQVNTDTTVSDIGGRCEHVRDSAVGLLKSFSSADYRHKTYDYGITGKNITEVIKKREEVTGIKYGNGCILSQSIVKAADKQKPICELIQGDTILGYNGSTCIYGEVLEIKKFKADQVICINNEISVTPGHKIFVKGKGWVSIEKLSLDDQLMDQNLESILVKQISIKNGNFDVIGVTTNLENLFSSGVLLHNKELD